MPALPTWISTALWLVTNAAVFAGFLSISLSWWQNERLQKLGAGRQQITRLKWIFALTAGIIGTLFIPAPQVRQFLAVALAFVLWAYLLRAGRFLVFFVPLKDGRKLRDELALLKQEQDGTASGTKRQGCGGDRGADEHGQGIQN